MNRSYYALAALMVVLGGSAVAVGSARCHCATASIDASRALCASGPRDVVVAASLFVQFDTSWEESRRASFAGASQGSADATTADYDESCGYDPGRDEKYDAASRDDELSDTLVPEYESWPSDERLEAGFQQFAESGTLPVCGGAELHCPYFAGRCVGQECEPSDDDSSVEEADFTDDECQRAHEQWLAEHQNEVRGAKQESGGDDWKTAPVATPDWITDYLSACKPSLEEQYAQAELQAAQDAKVALEAYGPTLPEASASEGAAYQTEYESLYNLDACLIPQREVMDEQVEQKAADAEVDGGPVVWSLSRIFGKVVEVFGDVLPLAEEQADEVYDAVDEALQQWNDLSSQLAMPRDDAAVLGRYSERFSDESDDSIISRDQQNVEPALPVETVQSREMLASLAGSLRIAGQWLLTVADGLEAEADHVLSAESEETWSR
jgi:hypothetical protein